jgi:hypothetical protein
LACPYFMPARKSEDARWQHPSRLPLGAGWDGCCTAPGHQGSVPDPEQLKEGCNLGYARSCPRLPQQRCWDAIRFVVAQESAARVVITYVCEKGHRPAAHGWLAYDFQRGFAAAHPDPCVQRMAECYLESYRARKAQFAETARAAQGCA